MPIWNTDHESWTFKKLREEEIRTKTKKKGKLTHKFGRKPHGMSPFDRIRRGREGQISSHSMGCSALYEKLQLYGWQCCFVFNVDLFESYPELPILSGHVSAFL